MKRLCVLFFSAMLLFSAGVCQAVDMKLYSVADGENDSYSHWPDGTRMNMWADDEATPFGTRYARRAIVKFDTSRIGQGTLRGAVLNLWGGRSRSGAAATVNVYHYAYDNWGESAIPYARPLGPFLASQQVDYTGYDRALYRFSIGDRLPYDNNGYLSLALTSRGNDAWFNTRNSVTWDGSRGHEPFIEFRTWSDSSASTRDGGFADSSALESWDASGPGNFQLVDNPYQDGDMAALLTTGSPIEISQLLDTPEDPFSIAFDYSFLTETGVLDVTLTNRDGEKWVLGQLAADSAMQEMRSAAFNVIDPDWLFLDNVTLGLEWDGPTGSRILLDNVFLADAVTQPPDPDPTPDPDPSPVHNIPEPATMILLILGMCGLAMFQRRSVLIEK